MATRRLLLMLIALGLIFAGCRTEPERPPAVDEPVAVETQPETEPVSEPAPEPEPEPEPVVEPEPEPVLEPDPLPEIVEQTEPAPIEVSEEVYDQTFSEVEAVIADLNEIIHARDFRRWRQYLTANYIDTMSSPETLAEISQSPILRRNNIVLRELEDYFQYVVVPSRARSHLDELVFYSDTVVEALTERDEVLYLLYQLRYVEEQWKIDIF